MNIQRFVVVFVGCLLLGAGACGGMPEDGSGTSGKGDGQEDFLFPWYETAEDFQAAVDAAQGSCLADPEGTAMCGTWCESENGSVRMPVTLPINFRYMSYGKVCIVKR